MTFKIHTSENFDVFEQVRLAEEVAPPGFRIHLDFNHSRSLAVVLPVIVGTRTAPHIVAYIEDPLKYDDIDGWRRLREQTRIPLVMQGVSIPHRSRPGAEGVSVILKVLVSTENAQRYIR